MIYLFVFFTWPGGSWRPRQSHVGSSFLDEIQREEGVMG